MWILKKLDDVLDSTKYLISDQHSYTVGRKNCDVIFQQDSSISRKHSTIYVSKKNDCPFKVNTPSGVWIVDEESKYGTYLKSNNDWIKLTPKQNKLLTNGSVIKFGLMGNIWSIEFKPIIACVSGISTDLKKTIQTTLKAIDGELSNAWSKECTFVVVNDITLTVKVVLALINGVPIVTPNYVQELVKNVKNQDGFPSYENFVPDIKESILDASLVSLDYKKTRKELFMGKKFVIPTKKQLETLKEVVLSAGGQVELFSNNHDRKRFADENVIMIQIPMGNNAVPEELRKSFEEVALFLKNKHGRRVVPESEIAQAVAYSSTEKYCNPKSNCFNLARGVKIQDLGTLLVEETPNESQKSNAPEGLIVGSSSTTDSQVHINFEKLETQKKTSDRKRNLSPVQSDHAFQVKKARNNAGALDEDPVLPSINCSSLEKGKMPISCEKTEVKATSSKKNNPQTSFLIKYFKDHSKPHEKSSKDEASLKEFWQNSGGKRKVSTDSILEETPSKKKAKLPADESEQSSRKPTLGTPKEIKALEHDLCDEEDNFKDFIEKEKMGSLNLTVDELNNTIYSLTLVSSTFLKEDGSLVDPPTVPVNVKQFRKQNVNASMVVLASEPVTDDLTDGDWIEPHPVMRVTNDESRAW